MGSIKFFDEELEITTNEYVEEYCSCCKHLEYLDKLVYFVICKLPYSESIWDNRKDINMCYDFKRKDE